MQSFAMGTRVRVRPDSATDAVGIGGQVGVVHGLTKPSLSRVDVVGILQTDQAVHVYFDSLHKGFWVPVELVEFVGQAPETVFMLKGVAKQWTQTSSGAVVEAPRRLPRGEWLAWLRNRWRRFIRSLSGSSPTKAESRSEDKRHS
jgi:hypothetical protein